MIHLNLLRVAFAEGDSEGVRRELEWANGKPSATPLRYERIAMEQFAGRRGTELVAGLTGQLGGLTMTAAAYAAAGDCAAARAALARAPRSVPPHRQAALAPALCGDIAAAESAITSLTKSDSRATALRAVWLPVSLALADIARGRYAAACEKLQPARSYELGQMAGFWPNYTAGLSYLGERRGAEAMAEFDKILTHRSVDPASPLYPLAYLGLARAAAMAGDTARSRSAYQALFTLWKDADADLPAFVAAKQEYARLQSREIRTPG